MLIKVNPSRFQGKPIFLRLTIIGNETKPDDYIAVCDDMVLARIMRVQKSFGRSSWDWTFTGPYIAREMGGANGSAASLDDAKTAVRFTFNRWVGWSSVQGKDADWLE